MNLNVHVGPVEATDVDSGHSLVDGLTHTYRKTQFGQFSVFDTAGQRFRKLTGGISRPNYVRRICYS